MTLSHSPLVVEFVADSKAEGWELRFTDAAERVVLHRRRASRQALRSIDLRTLLRLPPAELAQKLSARAALDKGHELFAWLFGDDDDQRRLFSALTGYHDANVLTLENGFDGTALELKMSDPELLEQPWHLLAFRGQQLLGLRWTIHCARPGELSSSAELNLTPTALLILPELQRGTLETPRHHSAIDTLVRRVGGYVETVSTLRDLLDAANRRWHLIYYYGHGRSDSDDIPELVFDTSESLRLSELQPLLTEMAPSIVYLNACQVGAGGWYGGGNLLSARGRVVLTHLCDVEAEHARRRAETFFGRLLGAGRAPATPVSCFMPDATDLQNPRHEWFCGSIHTSVRVWNVRGEPTGAVRNDTWALRLDRDPQRDRVVNEINNRLAKKPSLLRGVAFVAVGAEGNRVHDLGRQMLDSLRQSDIASLGARAVWIKVRVPPNPSTSAAWDDALSEALAALPGTALSNAVTNCLFQRGIGVGKGIVLWIDFDAHPFDPRPFRVEDWLNHCERWTSQIDVDGVRLAYFAGFEAKRDSDYRQRMRAFRTIAAQRNTEQFGVGLLEELGPADYGHLIELFTRSGGLRLDAGERQRVADGILSACKAPAEPPREAEYALVVAELERGRATQFSEFLGGGPKGGSNNDFL